MADYYLIAAGGTGIRVAIALLHCCAYGILARHNLHVLVLDTDEDQNADVLKNQAERYKKLRGIFQGSLSPDTPNGELFSAQVDVEVVDKAIKRIGDYELDRNTTIQMAWDASRTPQYSGEDKLFLKALLGNEQVNKTKPSNGLYGCPGLGALLLKPVIEKAPVMTGGIITDGKIMHFLNRYDADMPLAFCASSFGGTGVSSTVCMWNALADMSKLPVDAKRAILCLAPYFKIKNNNRGSWEREGIEKKHAQAKEFFEQFHRDVYRFIDPAQNPFLDRGEYIEEKQQNWPDLTEWHTAWILSQFYQSSASWKTLMPSDEDRNLLERFACLSWVWNEVFEVSVQRDRHKLLRSNALWTQTIPQKPKGMTDAELLNEPRLLENVILQEFLAEWQTWYLKMHLKVFELEGLQEEKERLKKKCDSTNGFADRCWEQASANSYGSKAKLLQALHDLFAKGGN